ncbi:MAG: hypothetical protein E7409_07280, partial [Ruminococcaceae bacterium]|nr:hypothetical protein [Oscillospiraceae bacterium]
GVVEIGEKNKAFSLGLDHSFGSISFANPASSGVVWYGLRFKVIGTLDGGAMFQLIDGSGNKMNLINILVNGASLYDGQYFADLRKNVWTDMHVRMDYTNNCYSVYVNGERVQKDWKIDTTVPAPARIGFEFTNPNAVGTIELDHVVVYRADTVMKKYPEQAFNPEVAEVTEGSAETVKRLYLHEDFNHAGGLNATYQNAIPKNGIIEVRNQQGHEYYLEGDRMYLHMESFDGGQDAKFDIVMNRFDASQYVIDMIINIFELNGRGFMFGLQKGYDANSKWLMAGESNGIMRIDGNDFNELTYKRWTRLSFVVDAPSQTYDVYIDGVLVREDCSVGGDPKDIDRLSFDFRQGTGPASVGIDAVAVYAGTELKAGLEEELYMENLVSSYPADDFEVSAFIGDKAVYCNTNSSFYKEGEKKKYEGQGYVTIEGTPMGIVEAMAGAYDITVSFDEKTQTATLSNGVTFTVGKDFFVIDGKEVSANGTFAIKDGVLYAPLSGFFEKALGKTVTYESTWELLFITEDGSKVNVSNTEMNKAVMRLMIFDRITGDEMVALVTERYPDKTHPRLSATKEEVARVKKNLQTDKITQRLYDYLRFNSDNILERATVAVSTDGAGYLNNTRSRDDILDALGHMYQMTGDTRYAERAMKELDSMIQLPYYGEGNPISAGPLVAAFAHAYDLFYDYMGEARREAVREIVKKMWTVNLFAYADAHGTRWSRTIKVKDNFNNNNSATMLMSALVFADEPDMTEMAKEIFVGSSRSLEYGNEDYAPDGEWPEGWGYWKYTILQWAPAVKGLQNVLGDTMGFEDHLGLRNGAYNAIDVSGIARSNDYNDASHGIKHSSRKEIQEQVHALFLFADLYDDPTIANAWLKNIDNYMLNNPGWPLMWYDPDMVGDANPTLDHRYRGLSDYIALRSSWEDDNAILLSGHTGQNYMSHSHIDGGTYVLDAMGLGWVCDLGTEDYANAYDPIAGNFYVTRPEAHNVYIINPRVGYQGQELRESSSTIEFETSARDGYAIVNMQPYYATEVVTAERGFKLADDRRCAVVRDEIALKGASEIYSFIHTQANIEVIDNNTAVFEQFGKKMLIEVTTNGRDLTLQEMACEFLPEFGKETHPNARKMDEYRKLAIKLNATGKLYINVKFTPLYEELTSTPAEDTDLAFWSCREGELEVPRLTSVSLDGEAIADFNPLNSQIEVDVPAGATKAPVITATAEDKYNVEVRQGSTDNLMDDVIIKVSEKENPANVWYYVVHFELTQYAIDGLDGIKLAQMQSIIAEESGANLTDVLTDRNLTTGRYESDWGSEYMIDLGSVQTVDSLITAFAFRHELDHYFFDISYSEDGANWKIKTCQQSAGSKGYERVNLGENIKARYIRFTANGRVGDKITQLREIAVAVR